MTQAVPNGNGYNFGALEERVAGLERSIAAISTKLDERQKFPYATLIAGAALLLSIVVTVGGVVMSGVNKDFGYLGGRLDRFEDALYRIQDSIVPRGEHQERWRSLEAGDANLQRQINDLNQKLDAIYPVNGVIVGIEERLKRIEDLRLQQTVPRATGQ